MPIEIVVVEDAQALAREAARRVAEQLRRKPDSVLGLPTGATPEGMYRELVKLHREAGLSFAGATTFNLDEYLGLTADDPASYRAYMKQHLFDAVDLEPARTFLPAGDAPDPEAECRRYEELIRRLGPVDLQILGIGMNGHIGFNEPGTPFDSRTHVVDLSEATRTANARYFPPGREVPRQALSMGIATILSARRILLLASGADKAEAVAAAAKGEKTPRLPASALQDHPGVTFLLDRSAAALLESGNPVVSGRRK